MIALHCSALNYYYVSFRTKRDLMAQLWDSYERKVGKKEVFARPRPPAWTNLKFAVQAQTVSLVPVGMART